MSRTLATLALVALAACGDDESTPPSGTPDGADPTIRLVSLGSHPSGQPIVFDVPEGATGFTLYAQFPLHSGFETLVAPGGAQVIQEAGIPGTAALFRAAPTFSDTPPPYGVAAAVPQSDAPGALPLVPGTWSVTLRDQIGTTVQVSDVRLVLRVPGEADGGTLAVNVFLAPGSIGESEMQSVVEAAFSDFAGIALGELRFFELGPDASSLSGEEEFRALLESTAVAGTTPGLNVLVVSDMSALQDDGKAGWIPGLTMWHGTDISGLAIEASGDHAYLALRLRHEAAHLAGLFHTTESDNVLADALADTPSCSDTALLEACPDASNLMFPIPNDAWSGALTSAQEQVIRASALYRGSP